LARRGVSNTEAAFANMLSPGETREGLIADYEVEKTGAMVLIT